MNITNNQRCSMVAALILALVPACQRQQPHPQEPPPAPEAAGEWSVSLGSAGGFSGGGGNTVVYSDGRIVMESWHQAGAAVEEQLLGKAQPAALQALVQAMNQPALVQLDFKNPANMTTTLVWREGDDVREYAWPFDPEYNDLPQPIRRAVLALDDVIESADLVDADE